MTVCYILFVAEELGKYIVAIPFTMGQISLKFIR